MPTRQSVEATLSRRVGRASALRLLLANASATFGLATLVLVALGASLADQLSPADPLRQSIGERLLPPMWLPGGTQAHVLGTDQLGRDILSRILFGGRISLTIGLLATALSGTLGTLVGLAAGYYGGRMDRVLMRLADIQLAFPFILLVVSIVAVLGPSLQNVIVALGISGWVIYARMARSQVLQLKQRDYVAAVRAAGASDARLIFRHILPNALSPLLVLGSFAVAQMIILESALNFLGLGVPPPTPTWGGMLADSRDYLALAWWLAAFPGLVLMLTLLAINLLGDWLRDLLDPRVQV